MTRTRTEEPTNQTSANRRRLLIISHDVVGVRMAGPGIRAWEMCRALAPHHTVTLIAPAPIDMQATSWRCGSYTWGNRDSLAGWLRDADVVLANGFVLHAHPELADITTPLVLDIYDPTLLENLELFRHAPANERAKQYQQDHTLLQQQLASGDFFLCATERQRDLYIGALMAGGRITPAVGDTDPQARGLIDVVPFGLPSDAPTKHAPALRGVIPGIGPDDPVLLWSGGMWDWMDPQSLVAAMPAIVASVPNARLVLLAGQHPGNAHPMQHAHQTRQMAEESGLLNTHIFFYDQWVPYQQRADVLLEATVAVSLHHNHLETRYAAVRSRILDHLWAGLPSLVSDGDAAAALIHEQGAGLVVPTGDPDSVAEAAVRLLTDATLRESCARAASACAEAFTWEQVTAPVARICQQPRITRPALAEPAPESTTEQEPEQEPEPAATLPAERLELALSAHEAVLRECRDAALAVQEQTWQLAERPAGGRFARVRQFLIDQVVRPFVAPIVEQQQAYNTAVLRSLYAANEVADHQRSTLPLYLFKTLMSYTDTRSDRIERRIAYIEAMRENQRMTRQQMYDILEQLAGLEEADSQLLALLHQAGRTPTAETDRTEANTGTQDTP